MRRIIYQMAIVFAILAGFVGISSANPGCPNLAAAGSANGFATVVPSGSLPSITYKVVTPTVPIQGLCVYEKTSLDTTMTGSSPLIGWSFTHSDSQSNFEFEDGGTHRITTTQTVGTANFGDNKPDRSGTNEQYALHVFDPKGACKGTADGTCWVLPGPGAPVPEVSTMALTTTGLLGLVLISKKYKNKK